MKSKKPKFTSCTQMRRQLVRLGTLSIATGEHKSTGEEWRTQPCGIPLFSDAEQERGTCKSCAGGWTHEHNYPVNS